MSNTGGLELGPSPAVLLAAGLFFGFAISIDTRFTLAALSFKNVIQNPVFLALYH